MLNSRQGKKYKSLSLLLLKTIILIILSLSDFKTGSHCVVNYLQILTQGERALVRIIY